MARIRPLSRPPITQATVSLGIAGGGADPEAFRVVQPDLAADYEFHDVRPYVENSIIFTTGETGAAPTRTEAVLGYEFASSKKQRFARFTLRELALDQLAPYPGWAAVREEVERLWELYRRAAPAGRVDRVSLRYANRLVLPIGVPLSERLTAPPLVPAATAYPLAGFLSHLLLKDPASGADLRLLQATEAGEAGMARLILDIECAREVEPEADWRVVLEDLRLRKNELFFASLTERMLEELE